MHEDSSRRRGWRQHAAALTAALVCAAGGCRTISRSDGDGRIVARSQAEHASVLRTDLATAIYAHDPDGDTVFVLSDLPREVLLRPDGVIRGQVIVIDLLWPPKAGSTPITSDATNTSVRQLVVIDGEAGIYAGAGFVMPSGSPGDGSVRLKLWDTTVRLTDASDGFRDMLSPATLTGGFTATRDDTAVRRIAGWIRLSTLSDRVVDGNISH